MKKQKTLDWEQKFPTHEIFILGYRSLTVEINSSPINFRVSKAFFLIPKIWQNVIEVLTESGKPEKNFFEEQNVTTHRVCNFHLKNFS